MKENYLFAQKKKQKKKHKIRRRVIVTAVIIAYVLFVCVPYSYHKPLSEESIEKINSVSCYAEEAGSSETSADAGASETSADAGSSETSAAAGSAERVALVYDNYDALICRLRMIDEARDEILFSTFRFSDDESGKAVLSALVAAAERGVKVKIVLDGFSKFVDLAGSPYFKAASQTENIEIRIYNPVNFLKPHKLMARLHDKYMIIDGRMFILSGRNTSDLFLGHSAGRQNIDLDTLVYETKPRAADGDTAIFQLKEYFAEVWNCRDTKPYTSRSRSDRVTKARDDLERISGSIVETYPELGEPADWEALTIPAGKVTLLSNPVDASGKEPVLAGTAEELMLGADKVSICTPYIICGKEMYSGLEAAEENGADVEVLTNHIYTGSNPFGCADYLYHKRKIHKTIGSVYEFAGSSSLHAKAVLIGDRLSLVGSYNLDMRSTYIDTELMLAVDSPEFNALMREKFEEGKSASRVLRDGEYVSGPNYVDPGKHTLKTVFYGILGFFLSIGIRAFI